MNATFTDCYTSPLGLVQVSASCDAITAVTFVDHPPSKVNANALTTLAIDQLSEYFTGHRHAFTLPLEAAGTPFQKQVWQALLSIEYGSLASYSDIATEIGNPKAVRAVGAANGKNPIAIVVPCHRVIGKNGTLTGYAGGIDKKQQLLALEQRRT
ncbi:methylated-DNA--[protein]-cysteine S-methyltransferase [Alteromonas sediminis]|uniref:Methylated-DNA--protein-cysteine methyltransferase n=1 Tax=Alteromonas sediminis TaxID=2259342 RepID=A0A3N5Y0Z4_9ALTE|nr:methylated-DNA--[protein]-cysteine S-methyltransferase [Alteromonas sediminis]RPJ66593.1 methylated-DNA--[protein]-cysteine S-methyltransferase [Alteromonas sediminis]